MLEINMINDLFHTTIISTILTLPISFQTVVSSNVIHVPSRTMNLNHPCPKYSHIPSRSQKFLPSLLPSSFTFFLRHPDRESVVNLVSRRKESLPPLKEEEMRERERERERENTGKGRKKSGAERKKMLSGNWKNIALRDF